MIMLHWVSVAGPRQLVAVANSAAIAEEYHELKAVCGFDGPDGHLYLVSGAQDEVEKETRGASLPNVQSFHWSATRRLAEPKESG
jgi:hypothetical protein